VRFSGCPAAVAALLVLALAACTTHTADPPHARPVGLALVDGGQRMVVADSNRFGAPGAVPSLAVVNVAAALAHKPALAGYLRAGGFPRQLALEPGGRALLVTDFDSQQLETVNVTNLP
jgi:hypothetical protein